jgi:cytochrome c5
MSEEAHTGPIKTPKQLLVAVFLSFVVPVLVIMGLVAYVANESKPAGSTQAESYTLGGVTAQDLERGVAERLRKVGTVEIRDANRPLKAGEEVYKAQCAACHTQGVAGAPKLGDNAAWASRIQQGFDALVTAALQGKGGMPAQAGGDHEDVEIARAVAFLANSAGGKFAEPQRPGPAQAATGGASAPAAPAPVAAAAPAMATAAASAAAPVAAAAGNGEAIYKQACLACHAAGVAGAPKLGDKAAWAPRLAQGLPALTAAVVKGKGAMPPRGGSTASDAELQAAVQYMVSTVRGVPAPAGAHCMRSRSATGWILFSGRAEHVAEALRQVGGAHLLQRPAALFQQIGCMNHVQRMDQAEAAIGVQEQPALLVRAARAHLHDLARVGRHLAGRLHAQHQRRRLEFHVDALRSVLEKPAALGVSLVVAVDEIDQLAMAQQ